MVLAFIFVVIIAILIIFLIRMRIRQQMLGKIIELTEKKKAVKNIEDDNEPAPSALPYLGDDDNNNSHTIMMQKQMKQHIQANIGKIMQD